MKAEQYDQSRDVFSGKRDQSVSFICGYVSQIFVKDNENTATSAGRRTSIIRGQLTVVYVHDSPKFCRGLQNFITNNLILPRMTHCRQDLVDHGWKFA